MESFSTKVIAGLRDSAYYLIFLAFALIQIVGISISFSYFQTPARTVDGETIPASVSPFGMYGGLYAFVLVIFSVYAVFGGIRAFGRRLFSTAANNSRISESEATGYEFVDISKAESIDTLACQLIRQLLVRRDHDRKVVSNCKRYGLLFAMGSISVPLFTWLVALGISLSATTFSNFWAITISSTTLGAITLSTGIALLKHAAKLEARADTAQRQIGLLERCRVLLVWPNADADTKAYAQLRAVQILSGYSIDQEDVLDGPDHFLQQFAGRFAASVATSGPS